MRKPSIELLDAYAEKYNYNIIGGNLTNIMVQQRKTDKTTLAPYIILRTVEVLMLKGLGVKEIFENATASSVSQLMQGFNTGEDFQIKQTNYTANDVMGLLNTFLQSLKQPLIPLNYLEMFLDVLDQESKDKSVNVVTGIAQIINSKLSNDEYNALQALIFLSYHLNLNSQTNELNLKIITAKLIVPIFLPHTIRHTENQILIKEKTKQQVLDEIIALGKLLIKKYKELFKNYFNYYGINKYLQLLYKYGGHEKSIRGIRKLDKEIWSYDYRGAIHIWSLQHSKFIKAIQLPMPINDLIFINEEVWIVGDYLLIIHLQTHEVIKSFKSANLLEPDFSFSVSEGLNNTVWVGRSDSISIYDKKEKTLIQELNIVAQEDHPGSGKTRFCNSIILVSKQYLWCAFSDGFIHIFNPETLAEITSFKAHSLTINSLIYVNSLVWSCSDDKTIAVWHANGDFYKRLDDHTSKVITLASYKDVFVCSSSWDNDIFLWDAKLLTLISKIQTTGHKDAITSLLFIDLSRKKRPSVAFSNVATRLSSATSKDAKLHLWTGSFDKMISIFLVNYQNWQMKLSKGIRNTIALTNSSYIISRTLQSSGSNSNVRYALFPPEITRFFESKSTNVISESMLEIDWSRSFNKNGILAYYKGKVQSQQVMACVIEPALYLDPNLSQEILNFLYKTRTLAHPNFALCLGFASVNGNIVVLTKYEKRNSLREVIISGNKGTPLERLTMAKELAIALSWLHNSDPPIGHYDLKDSCILLGKNSAVKLTNFGYFELKQKQERYKKEIPIHLAPEIVLGQPFGIKADIFSYGLLIWQCWTGQLAPIQLNKVVIENYEKLKSSLEEKHRITVGAIPARLIKLITNCQNDDPEKRPTALEILAAFDELYTDCIVQDFEGRTFWKMYYPHSQIVNCNILVSSIGTYFTIKELEDACTPQSFAMKILFGNLFFLFSFFPDQFILTIRKETPKGSGNSSVQRFADLIQWFGPFNKSIVTKVCTMDYFTSSLLFSP